MQVIRSLGRAFWIGLLMIGLAVAVWFAAPSAQSCVTDFTSRECDTTGVVVLNIIGLILFVIGGGSLLFAGAAARSRANLERRSEGKDTR